MVEANKIKFIHQYVFATNSTVKLQHPKNHYDELCTCKNIKKITIISTYMLANLERSE